MTFEEDRSSWEARQERAVFTRAAIEEAGRERAALGPVSSAPVTNLVEEAFVAVGNYQSTIAMLAGEPDRDEQFDDLVDEVRTELRLVENESPPDVLTGVAPFATGGLLRWLFRFVGISYVLDKLGLPTPVMDLLQMAGESLGLEGLAGKLPFLGEPRVAVYWRSRLLGVMDLSSWADFRGSMKRIVWQEIRTRVEG